MPTLPVCLCRNKFDRKGRRRVLLGPRAFLWVAAIGAGALLIVADLLSLTISPKGPSVESLTSGAYAVQSVLKLAAAALLLFGLLGLHLRQAGAAGNLGIAGFLAAFFGTTLVVGAFWAMPSLRRRWPPALPNGSGWRRRPPPGRLAEAFVFSWAVFILGWVLFGVAATKAQVYPRAATILLIFGAVPVFGSLLVVGFPTSILFSAAIVWLGFALLTGGAESAEQPSRVR